MFNSPIFMYSTTQQPSPNSLNERHAATSLRKTCQDNPRDSSMCLAPNVRPTLPRQSSHICISSSIAARPQYSQVETWGGPLSALIIFVRNLVLPIRALKVQESPLFLKTGDSGRLSMLLQYFANRGRFRYRCWLILPGPISASRSNNSLPACYST